ncbi:MAG: AraC family transcriptional regulator [Bacteroidota bacterium]|nr:AraC family transcriptional regulator [Bacteroidota bacterium]
MDKGAVTGIDNFLEYFSEPVNQVRQQSARYLTSETYFSEPKTGTCIFKEIRMPHFTLLDLAFDLKKDLRIIDQTPAEGVSSVFVLEGNFTSQFTGLSKNAAPGKQRHNLLYTPDASSNHNFSQGVFRAVHLSYDMDFFKSLLDPADPRFAPVLEAIDRKNPLLVAQADLPLPTGIQHVLRDFQQCTLQGATRHLYLEAKAMELFTWQMDQVLAATNVKLNASFPKADLEKLQLVHDYIQKNYLHPLTLTDLAKQFGLNEFKLKNGYKKLFGTPVYKTIHHLRMQTAADLLQNNILNISEVADFVGYSHISHFSAAFKKKFGYPPSMGKKVPVYSL